MDEYKRHHKGKLELYQNLIAVNTVSIENITREIAKLNTALPTCEEFVKLVHSYLETVLNTRDLIEEDAVYQEVVSNLRVKDDVVSVIKLNPPYDLMVDFSENSSWSRGSDITQTLMLFDIFTQLCQKISGISGYDDGKLKHIRL